MGIPAKPWCTTHLSVTPICVDRIYYGLKIISRVCRNGAKIDLLIMIAVGFGLSEALTISGGAKMVAGVSYGTAT